MSTKKGVKKELRSPQPNKDLDEWIETGKVSSQKTDTAKRIPVDKTYSSNAPVTTTVPFEIVDLFDNLTRKHRRQTGQNISRAGVMRIWMYALSYAPQQFRDEFLNAAPDEDEMLAILLKQLRK